MELRLILMALICLCIAQLAFATENIYPFEAPQIERRFIDLTKELRCSSCQNQTIFESNAAVAVDMREKVYNMLQQGATDTAIREYLATRYGDYILFNPQWRLGTAALWLAPFAMLLVGFWTFANVMLPRKYCP